MPAFGGFAKTNPKPAGEGGTPAAAQQMPKATMPMAFSRVNIIVTGGSNNNYWSVGGLSYSRSVQIDKWR
jgi:hypothetical protein